MTTINEQIAAIEARLIEDSYQIFDDEPELRNEIGALSARRLNKAQKELIGAIKQGMAEWDAEEGHGPYNMGQHIAKYRDRYQLSIAASGAKSLNNGDELAKFLEMKTGKEVCELADQHTPIKDGQTHWERYERLNEGQKRMNSGNKLRAAAKKGLIVVTENGITAA